MKENLTLSIKGMTCASCVNRVEKALTKNDGILSASVNLATEKANISFDSQKLNSSSIIDLVKSAGYEAFLPQRNEEQAKAQALKEEKQTVLFSLLFTLPLVQSMLTGTMLPPWIQLVLATPVQFYIGARFYKSAWSAIKARQGNMELLVAIGTSAAYFLSLYLMSKNIHHLYFEGSAVIITMVLLGKYLESKAKQQTSEAIKALQKLTPLSVRIKTATGEEVIPLGKLKLGDLVICKAGERIPVDGIIKEGITQVNESLITGESLPLDKFEGDKVVGGSLNGESLILIRVTALGSETVLARIIRLVEDAQVKKAPIQKLVDKMSGYFVPVVLIIAFFTVLLTGLLQGHWEEALIHGIAVLVIACPCALGLATPTSIMVGTGVAAKAGILIKDVEALEVTHSLTTIVFDKTGTLTEGLPSVKTILPFGITEDEVLKKMASLQQGSEHPLAQAVLQKAQQKNISLEGVSSLKTLPGRGLEAFIQTNKFYLGSKRLLTELNISDENVTQEASKHEELGETVSFLINGETLKVLGMISYSDTLKPNSKKTIDHLKKLGIKTLMMTGDNQGSAKVVASLLGIDSFRSDVLPEHKSQLIKELSDSGEIVGMVGDGINDAPALMAAHVGMAMSTGTDVAMHSAGITLMRGEPLLIPDAISISRSTYAKIKQNLFWAFIYNVIGIPLAALGYLSPTVAGAAMALSSVSVVTNSLLLKRWKRSL